MHSSPVGPQTMLIPVWAINRNLLRRGGTEIEPELANRTGLLGANYSLWPFWHPNDGATQWGESGSAIGAVL